MKNMLVLYFATTVLCAIPILGETIAPVTRSGGKVSQSMTFMGAADGKSIFAIQANFNWTQAAAFCEDMSMSILSISSRAQWDVIANYNDESTGILNDWYWASARDAHTHRQLSWTNGIQPESYIPWTDHAAGDTYLSCGLLYLRPMGTSQLGGFRCSYTGGGVLCQLP